MATGSPVGLLLALTGPRGLGGSPVGLLLSLTYPISILSGPTVLYIVQEGGYTYEIAEQYYYTIPKEERIVT